MDMIAHCRAMAVFCRQHAQFENEDSTFWMVEAREWDSLIAEYSDRYSPVKSPKGTSAPPCLRTVIPKTHSRVKSQRLHFFV